MRDKELLLKAKSIYESSTDITLKEVSSEIGISSERISKFLKDSGVEIRKGHNPNTEKYKIGKTMYLNGFSIGHISKELGICRNRFSQYLKKNKVEVIQLRHKIRFNNTVFETIDTEAKAYWLGFLYADGCVGSNRSQVELGLSIKDESHVYKFRDFLESSHKISEKDSKMGRASRIIIEDKLLHSSLIKLGCVPKKSLILKFPSNKQVPNYLIKHFIRGYFDGDGGFTYTDKTVSINILGTGEFLSELKKQVDVLNNKKLYPMRYDDKNKNTFRIQFESKKDIKTFLDYIYKDSNIKLERKYEKYIKFCLPS